MKIRKEIEFKGCSDKTSGIADVICEIGDLKREVRNLKKIINLKSKPSSSVEYILYSEKTLNPVRASTIGTNSVSIGNESRNLFDNEVVIGGVSTSLLNKRFKFYSGTVEDGQTSSIFITKTNLNTILFSQVFKIQMMFKEISGIKQSAYEQIGYVTYENGMGVIPTTPITTIIHDNMDAAINVIPVLSGNNLYLQISNLNGYNITAHISIEISSAKYD